MANPNCKCGKGTGPKVPVVTKPSLGTVQTEPIIPALTFNKIVAQIRAIKAAEAEARLT